MKIFDCFMYFDEDIVLDVRLNYLFSHVDKFVIVEAKSFDIPPPADTNAI